MRKLLGVLLLLGSGALLVPVALQMSSSQPSSPVHATGPVEPIIDATAFQPVGAAATPAPASPASSHEGLRVRLPELGVDLPIVDGDGYNAPLYKAAAYPGLAWPGEGARSVVYAHALTGMFGPLFNAKVGQRVEITRPGRQPLRYRITEYYAHWPISDLRWLRARDGEQLVLITCTTYNYNEPRIVVVAEPL